MLVVKKNTLNKTEKGSNTSSDRAVFFVSDGTGITAEALGNSLLTQFDNISFSKTTMPFIDTVEKAENLVKTINEVDYQEQLRPIIFSTIIDDEIRAIIESSKGFILDIFSTYIGPLEMALGEKSSHTVGLSHSIKNQDEYTKKMNALNFTLSHDDGVNTQNYSKAELILVGISRTGKTPTSIYLAMQYGIYVANYPLVEEELQEGKLPEILENNKNKIVALSIEPNKLSKIREARLPNSKYAQLDNCTKEVNIAISIYKENNLKLIDSTGSSVEEIAAKILLISGLKRKF